MTEILTFAGTHPIITVLLGIPLIGWSARIIIAMIRAL